MNGHHEPPDNERVGGGDMTGDGKHPLAASTCTSRPR
jgi:hypothetical protein